MLAKRSSSKKTQISATIAISNSTKNIISKILLISREHFDLILGDLDFLLDSLLPLLEGDLNESLVDLLSGLDLGLLLIKEFGFVDFLSLLDKGVILLDSIEDFGEELLNCFDLVLL